MTIAFPVERVRRKILLVEDEPALVMTVTDRLESESYEVSSVADGDEAFRLAASNVYDLLILDVALPGRNGFDLCRDLRQRGIPTPILMLTARAQVIDRVLGLKLGADDYLTKPFDMLELLARVEALLRRSRAPLVSSGEVACFGNVRADFRSAEVLRDGEQVELSTLELKLLRYFVGHRGAVLSRDELLENVWGYDSMPYTRTVDVHVGSLRQKIEPNPSRPRHIVTVHGLGYKFVE